MELAQSFAHCPYEWKNFVIHLQYLNNIKEGTGISVEIIDAALSSFNANYAGMTNNDDPFIMFDNEADLIMFKLKYSN